MFIVGLNVPFHALKKDQEKVQILDQRQEEEIVLKELMVDLHVQERIK